MNTLKAAAIDMDGVLVADTFSPVIKALVEHHGGVYDRDVERQVFSQNRKQAARYLLDRLGLPLSEQELVNQYFQRRAEWLLDHDGGALPGIDEFLGTLSNSGMRLICYGGLEPSHFEAHLARWKGSFETYVCTDGIRPGVTEIVNGTLGLPPQQVVFFDDVSRVAEAARDVGTAFIGVPASWPWGYQKQEMVNVGVPIVISSLKELTAEVLADCDERASQGYWRPR